MQSSQLADRYLKEQVETASPEQILLLLYDGAIRFLRIAKKAMAEREWERCHNHLLKTQNILTELMTSLNFEVGGEVAENLYRLYDYYIWSLIQANIHRDPKPLDEVMEHLKNLKQTWEEAIKIAAQETPSIDIVERSSQNAEQA